MDLIRSICAFIRSHKKLTFTALTIIVVLFIISKTMTYFSIEYVPLKLFDSFAITSNSISISYSKKVSYSESVSVFSVTSDMLSDVTPMISAIQDTIDAASILENATENEGTLVIPANISGIRMDDLAVYGWGKKYSIFFNQIDCVDIEVVFIYKNSAISGKLSAGGGVLSEIALYQLS